jgi:hypothetical protein
MLFINLTPVLYTLKNFRAYVLKKPTTKSNIALLANNTIVFNLTKTEMANTEKFKENTQYNNLILSYNKINYIDDQYQHLNKQYPSLKTLNTSYKNIFEQVFNLIKKNGIETLSSVILIREKTKFKIRVMGLLGRISIIIALNNFANLWNKKKKIDYNTFIKVLLYWLRTNVILNINSVFLNIYLKKKNLQKMKKIPKSFVKKQTSQKPLIIFSNENIII